MPIEDGPDASATPGHFPPEQDYRARAAVRRANRWRVVRNVVGGGVVVCAAALGIYAGAMYRQSPLFRTWLSGFGRNPRSIVTGIIHRDPLAAFQPDEQFPGQQSMNVLVLGCDVDYLEDRPVEIKGTNGRSDSMLLAHLDFQNKTINVLSIPRDTAVRVPGHGIHKINAANAFGGPELSEQTVESVFGVKPDYYVSINFDGFRTVVDKLGGIDLTVHKQMDYDDNWGNLHIHLKPGYQHLNGYRAMGYVRFRHSDSDFARAERQHEFLEALRSKVMDLRNFERLPGALGAVSDALKTNLTQAQILTVAGFARGLQKDRIQLATLPSIEGPSYVYVNVPPSEQVISKMFFDGRAGVVSIDAPSHTTVAMGSRRVSLRRRHGRGRRGARGEQPVLDAAPLDASPDPDNGVVVDPQVDGPPPVDSAPRRTKPADQRGSPPADGSSKDHGGAGGIGA